MHLLPLALSEYRSDASHLQQEVVNTVQAQVQRRRVVVSKLSSPDKLASLDGLTSGGVISVSRLNND